MIYTMLKTIVSKKYNESSKRIEPWYILKVTKDNKTYIGEGYSLREAEYNLYKSYDAEFYD